MKLFLYIFKDFLKYVSGIVLLCLFLFILFDFIHKTTGYFGKYEPSARQVLSLYFFQLPSNLIQAFPIATLFGSVITMLLLSRTNEVTAMRAAGMSPLRIGIPLAMGGMVLSLAAVFLGEFIQPSFMERMYYVKDVEIERQSASELSDGAHWVRDQELMFSFKDYDPEAQVLSGVQLIELGPSFLPQQILLAETGVYLPEQESWSLAPIVILHMSDLGRLQSRELVAERVLKLPVSPSKLKKERRLPGEMSAREVVELIKRRKDAGLNTQDFEVDLHFKLSFGFSAFVLSLIGLQFGFRSERTTETIKGVLIAFGVGISYFFIATMTKTFCSQSGLNPILGAWVPNVVILGFSILQNSLGSFKR